jgi:putative DNA methylase
MSNPNNKGGHTSNNTRKAIEEGFPFVEVSKIAERESYRKEIFRPLYHIHKWWATRLGSVFRAISLGVLLDEDQDIWSSYYKKHNFSGTVIADPFMGSGTTLGEAAKLGAQTIGCDINPVSTFIAKQALTSVKKEDLLEVYRNLEEAIQSDIASYYTTSDRVTGEKIPIMYTFWVTLVKTPDDETIPLFRSYVFSKNAYPKKKPEAKIICPSCWHINDGNYNAKQIVCSHCGYDYNPQEGRATGQYVTDSKGAKHKIVRLIQQSPEPPEHRMFAIIALSTTGEKVYLKPTEEDFCLYESAKTRLQEEELPLPILSIREGHNTKQVLNYNYTQWHQFFNHRQLLCLGLLLREIKNIENSPLREHFLCLFSSVLEFNNMFCSFKGEGTGAVRHIFSHHILKPERVPLENSVWGLPKSSGTFASLFKSRLLKAKKYLENPFELYLQTDLFGNIGGKSQYKVASEPINLKVATDWEDFSRFADRALILNGDSSNLPIPDESVDSVITDPPYFDFVNYSELSDFFFAWLSPVLSDDYSFFDRSSSYAQGEVQDNDPVDFAVKLSSVFKECYRVLKPEGLLCFSFHHSQPEGWLSIRDAIRESGFCVVATYPVHGEMKVASPKSNAKSPITIDMLLVCRKEMHVHSNISNDQVEGKAKFFIEQLKDAGIRLSDNDLFNVYASLYLLSNPKRDVYQEFIAAFKT